MQAAGTVSVDIMECTKDGLGLMDFPIASASAVVASTEKVVAGGSRIVENSGNRMFVRTPFLYASNTLFAIVERE